MLITVSIIGGLLALLLIVALTKPNVFRVERAASIDAPPEKIFAYIQDFRQWTVWSPWEKLDADLQREYSGAPSGVGAKYAWQGKKSGKGRMEIVAASPREGVEIQLDFEKPFESSNVTHFKLEPSGGATRITWTMSGPNKFMGKLMSVFINMDKMVGKSFEEGLASLKKAAEG